MAMTESWVKGTAAQDSRPFKTVTKNIHPLTSTFLFTDKKTFRLAKRRNPQNDWQYTPKRKVVATKDVHAWRSITHGINRQATSGWQYALLITLSGLTRPIIATWCRYNSSCFLYVRSQASSSSFSRTVPRRTRRSYRQSAFLTRNFARYT